MLLPSRRGTHHKNVFNGLYTIFRPWKSNGPGFKTIERELKVLEGKENQHNKSAQNGKKALTPYVPQIAVNEGMEVVIRANMEGGDAEILLMEAKGGLHHVKTEYAEARHINEGIPHQTSPTLSPIRHALALRNIGDLDIHTGASAEIVSHNLNLAEAICQKAQYKSGIFSAERLRAILRLREGDVAGGHSELRRLFACSSSYGFSGACLSVLASPGCLLQSGAKIPVIFLAFAMRSSLRTPTVVHDALWCFGFFQLQQDMDHAALSIFQVALEGFTWMDVHQGRAECMRMMGDIHLRRGETAKASTFWKGARPLFERSLQAKAVAEIDARLAELEKLDEAKLTQLSHLNVPTMSLQQLSIATEATETDINITEKPKVLLGGVGK
ncbi:hypothetical protein K438DRAFT_1779951 [Mycena galopus ATCC 62051]|nr:hypothetical protein K438DRAFT_1779951 [Mycena galopus ATCC 62051]